MSKRLELIAESVKKAPPFIAASSFDYLNLASFLTPQENVGVM